jgi:UDP-2-acetamido-2,6-beta-L-arabino-hexul-4-ose reductase
VQKTERVEVPYDFEKRVTEILALLNGYKALYFDQGFIPSFKDRDEVNLFNTFRCYIDHAACFPKHLISHADSRGVFVETIKLGTGGQVSFSTTVPGVTRGNHYHTRKIERFTVIKGKARIQLRKTGTDKILNFYLDGETPSYVDMPVWYTHNITNIGDEDLYTQFWINEWYDPDDGDTYYEEV